MNALKVVLTLIPFLWTVGALPFVNHVKPLIFGLPFLAFWLCCSIIVAFVCLSVLYKIDSKNNQDS